MKNKETLFLLLVTFSILQFNSTLAQNGVNLSGRWKLNVSKSSFGEVPVAAMHEFYELKQTKDSLSIMKQGDVASKQTISLDGKTTTVQSLLNKPTTSTKVLEKGMDGLVKESTFAYESIPKTPYQTKSSDKFKLISNGKELIIERTMEVSDPALNWKIAVVYEKVE